MSRIALAAVLLATTVLWPPLAHADDSPAVLELKQGYALKQQGDCRAALAHFVASYRASPTAKALLNEADCEARLGQLVQAKLHATEGRALARQGADGIGMTADDAALVGVADELMASVDRRLPHLAIKLAPGQPTDCTVARDGASVDPATIGASVAVDPGPHTVVVKAPGRQNRSYDLDLREGQVRELAVEAGATAATALPANPYNPPSRQMALAPSESRSLWTTITANPRNEVAAAVIAGGALAVVVGAAFGAAAISNNGASNSNGHCDATGCDPIGVQLRNTALSDATASTILFGAGLAAVAGGVVLSLTGPRRDGKAALGLVPRVGGLQLQGAW